ncbi:MAG: nickel pincer cofactor biosynthesis protein LarB [Anaerovoracaceae bacterium]|jgi:NCAIR mutase (PurE)-related protein
MNRVKELLEKVKNGEISVDEAFLELKKEPFEDIGIAKIDRHREIRQGTPEVIFGEGKTKEQILEIARALKDDGVETILVTRLDQDKAEFLSQTFSLRYNSEAHAAVIGRTPDPDGIGTILIATGGTADIPVAEEAAFTAEALGNEVVRLYDVGVAGIHRTLAHLDEIMNATVIIAIAGMEGALASVIGGLADCPVIAVPTSVGYGASFNGLSALLSMLNSCASGVTVVNIDNGFGAAYTASRINHINAKERNTK